MDKDYQEQVERVAQAIGKFIFELITREIEPEDIENGMEIVDVSDFKYLELKPKVYKER